MNLVTVAKQLRGANHLIETQYSEISLQLHMTQEICQEFAENSMCCGK